jgi:hypothetical protein
MLLTLILCTLPTAAQDLLLVSPTPDDTSDPIRQGFIFTIQTPELIETCSLVVDNTAVKTIGYRDTLLGRSFTYTADVPAGQHNWTIACRTPGGTISAPAQPFTATREEQSEISVTSSGTIRGSLIYGITIKATAPESFTIRKLAAGDFLSITYEIPPSKITKELYLKQLGVSESRQFALFQDDKSRAQYRIFEGESQTVAVGSTTVTVQYLGKENNRGIVRVTPVSGEQAATEQTDEGIEMPADAETPQTPANAPDTSAGDENEENGASPGEQPPSETTEPGREQQMTPETPPAEPQEGFVKRLLRWFVNVFG